MSTNKEMIKQGQTVQKTEIYRDRQKDKQTNR